MLVLERRHRETSLANPVFLAGQFGLGERYLVLARASRQIVDHLVACRHHGRRQSLGKSRIEGLDLDVEVAAKPL